MILENFPEALERFTINSERAYQEFRQDAFYFLGTSRKGSRSSSRVSERTSPKFGTKFPEV